MVKFLDTDGMVYYGCFMVLIQDLLMQLPVILHLPFTKCKSSLWKLKSTRIFLLTSSVVIPLSDSRLLPTEELIYQFLIETYERLNKFKNKKAIIH
ncbi:hypothetical protein [Neobacillus niacini]|uniref:hypothetical protein n=1 Tax=Neobacillus niacini TaxID=86668 RepID=UPI00203B7453|nr:hypothetical protein [Neobacillus niacini]MCM3694096.1 hypothetical protein [Neobacillus niacini]